MDAIEARKLHDNFNKKRDEIFRTALAHAKITPELNNCSTKHAIQRLAKKILREAFVQLKEATRSYGPEHESRFSASYTFNQMYNSIPLREEIEKILLNRKQIT